MVGGLYLQVTSSGSKSWIFRFRSPFTHKLRDMGLGSLHAVGLPLPRRHSAEPIVVSYPLANNIKCSARQIP